MEEGKIDSIFLIFGLVMFFSWSGSLYQAKHYIASFIYMCIGYCFLYRRDKLLRKRIK